MFDTTDLINDTNNMNNFTSHRSQRNIQSKNHHLEKQGGDFLKMIRGGEFEVDLDE